MIVKRWRAPALGIGTFVVLAAAMVGSDILADRGAASPPVAIVTVTATPDVPVPAEIVTPTQRPGPESGSDPDPEGPIPRAGVVAADRAGGRPPARRPAPQPPNPSDPPPAERCPDGRLLTVRVPLGALPCTAAVVGGRR